MRDGIRLSPDRNAQAVLLVDVAAATTPNGSQRGTWQDVKPSDESHGHRQAACSPKPAQANADIQGDLPAHVEAGRDLGRCRIGALSVVAAQACKCPDR